MLSFHNLVKEYSDGTLALNGIKGSFPSGALVVVLGDNGTGKTTLLKILAKLLNPTKGEVQNNFVQPIGYMGQDSGESFYELLTVYENLRFFAKLNEKDISEEETKNLLSKFNVEDLIDKKFYKLSGGQKKLLSLLRSFLHNPELIILDEPFSGISPEKIGQICGFIQEYIKRNDALIIISSHSLEHISLFFDLTFYLTDRKGYLLTNDFIKKILEQTQVIDLLIDYEYVSVFDSFVTKEKEILFQKVKGKYAQTLVTQECYNLREEPYFKVVNIKKPS